MSLKLKLLLLAACCYALSGNSQTAIIDIKGYSPSELVLPENIYHLYNGKEYFHYAPSLYQGHPFFDTYSFINGSLEVDGKVFENVPMMYDLVTDQLIVQHFNNFNRIQLFRPDVKRFTLGDIIFVQFNIPGHSGFYQQISNGKIPFYIKRVKRIKDNLEGNRIRLEIEEENRFYILKEGKLAGVRKLKTLLNEMGDYRDEVRQYLKKNKIRKGKELVFTTAIAYYDQISANEN